MNGLSPSNCLKFEMEMAGKPDNSAISYVHVARAKLFTEIRRKTGQRTQVWTLKEGLNYVGYALTEICSTTPPSLYVSEIYLEPGFRHDKGLWKFFRTNIREVATKMGIKKILYRQVVR